MRAQLPAAGWASSRRPHTVQKGTQPHSPFAREDRGSERWRRFPQPTGSKEQHRDQSRDQQPGSLSTSFLCLLPTGVDTVFITTTFSITINPRHR